MISRFPAVLASEGSEAQRRAEFAQDVRYYLTLSPRQLPSRYLYDPLGSALFEAICHLPWYPLTRSETELLEQHACDIAEALQPLQRIVELGAGSGDKLARVIGALRRERPLVEVHLIDVSGAALEAASRRLGMFDLAGVFLHHGTYEAGLQEIVAARSVKGRSLVLFLGSNIGNYDPPGAEALLRQMRATLGRDDRLLVGADLIKSPAELLAAYDDPLQVTAAFNRNLLVRMNRELDANFDLGAFAHRAVWNAARCRVEMHLVSTREQSVAIAGAELEIDLAVGEIIWTESSYKFDPDRLARLFTTAGLALERQWIHLAGRFALMLLRPF